MHQITAIFEDAESISFDARPDEIVYQAAYRAGMLLEHDCLEGACGTCKALCTQGEFAIDDYSDEALSDDERALGYTLLCRMTASAPCVLELPYPSSHIGAQAPQWRAATLVSVEMVSASVARTVLHVEGDALQFQPGQYLNLEIPGTQTPRSYSFANLPGTQEIELFQKVYAQGAMSDCLRAWVGQGGAPAAAIRVKGPAGHFYLRPPRRPVLMVAGGTGLGPMLAMLRSLERDGAPDVPLHLLLGANQAGEFFATEELARLAQTLPLTVERIALEAEGWQGACGHVTSLLRTELLHGGDCDAYLCGPPPMVEAAASWLRQQQLPQERIHAERFVAGV